MKILITNDDGIQVDALAALADALGGDHQVWVVAPEGNRSGQSMSITLHQHLMVREIKPRWHSCSGSPTDCVLMVLLGALGEKPDLILSGVNYGPNLGTDLLYSGTAAAAREGALKGVPSIALSVNQMEAPWNFSPAIQYIKENLQRLYSLCGEGYFLNVNFPKDMNEESCLRMTEPCRREYQDSYKVFDPPRGPRYFFPHGTINTDNPRKGTDLYAVMQGYISVSPIVAAPQLAELSMDRLNRLAELEGSCG